MQSWNAVRKGIRIKNLAYLETEKPCKQGVSGLFVFIAILVNNAFKTVQQSAKDKEDICRRADARQRYLTQDFTLWWAGLRCIILEDCYSLYAIVCDGNEIEK